MKHKRALCGFQADGVFLYNLGIKASRGQYTPKKEKGSAPQTMIKVLVLADDVTGALDAGVKFSDAGLKTKVSLLPKIEETDTGASVLVLCVPTRHETPETAYRQVRALSARAAEKHIGCIFKKTDSALRGNVGAELAAVLDGSGEHELFFIPALPAMNRVTINGIHYINGVPVHESVFGDDPFEPVTESYIPALLEKQMNEPVEVITGATPPAPVNSGKRIAVLDCETQSGMEKLTRTLYESGRLHAVAGCSGLAEALAAALCGSVSETEAEPETERLTVVCGSMNPISLEQVAYAEKTGYAAVSVPVERLLETGLESAEGKAFLDALWAEYSKNEHLLIETGAANAARGELPEEIGKSVASLLGAILKDLLDRGAVSRLMIIGGDTLLGFMDAIGCRELSPQREILQGVVESEYIYRGVRHSVLSKSGGFGQTDLLLRLESEAPVHA